MAHASAQPDPGHGGLLEQLVEALRAIEQIEGLMLGGSRATGQADEQSDIDLYIYSTHPVPASSRARLIQDRASRFEIGNQFWELGDEWDERETGIHVDLMYRDWTGIREALARVLDRHEAAIGYTTCLWHNVLSSKALFDRNGALAALQALARRPYPEALARAIIGKNHPLIRGTFSAFGGQMLKAAQRDDAVALNHRTAAFLASYFDIVFAANRAPHPGEKRLLHLAAALPHLPAHMREDVNALLLPQDVAELARLIDSLADNLDALLQKQGLAPAPSGT